MADGTSEVEEIGCIERGYETVSYTHLKQLVRAYQLGWIKETRSEDQVW